MSWYCGAFHILLAVTFFLVKSKKIVLMKWNCFRRKRSGAEKDIHEVGQFTFSPHVNEVQWPLRRLTGRKIAHQITAASFGRTASQTDQRSNEDPLLRKCRQSAYFPQPEESTPGEFGSPWHCRRKPETDFGSHLDYHSAFPGNMNLLFSALANLCRGMKIATGVAFFPNSAKNPLSDIIHLVTVVIKLL